MNNDIKVALIGAAGGLIGALVGSLLTILIPRAFYTTSYSPPLVSIGARSQFDEESDGRPIEQLKSYKRTQRVTVPQSGDWVAEVFVRSKEEVQVSVAASRPSKEGNLCLTGVKANGRVDASDVRVIGKQCIRVGCIVSNLSSSDQLDIQVVVERASDAQLNFAMGKTPLLSVDYRLLPIRLRTTDNILSLDDSACSPE